MTKSMLEENLENVMAKGWKVFVKVDGLPAPQTKQSNLYKAMQSAAEAGYKEITYITGGHKRNYSDGFHMAVIVK